MSKLEFRCQCGKEAAHIEGDVDLWWLFMNALGWKHEWDKQIKYVVVCPDLRCNYSSIAYNGQPSPDLLKHLAIWQPLMQFLAWEYWNCRYYLSDKQWKARRYPKKGVPMAPLPRETSGGTRQ
jgi:hypothetical protein